MPPEDRAQKSLVAAALVAVVGLSPALTLSQPSPPAGPAAPVAAPVASSAATGERPGLEREQQIAALLVGELALDIEPATLFDVPLDDDEAVRLAAARTRALLGELAASTREKRAPEPAAKEKKTPSRPSSPASASASASASAPEAPGPPPVPASAAVAALAERLRLDPSSLEDRLGLDRARLAFYELEASERAKVLERHRERQQARIARETEQERRAREAERERQRALAAVRQAHSEAERLVSEELARLLGLEASLVSLGERFDDEQAALRARRDKLLGWQRRAREARGEGNQAADTLHEELREALLKGLDEAQAALLPRPSHVPALGGDPLSNLKLDAQVEKARAQRQKVEAQRGALLERERGLRDERAAALMDELSALNRERLALLPSLSAELRGPLTGFSAEGWAQARAEARQLRLILGYHRDLAARWLTRLRDPQAPLEETAGRALLVAIPWVLLGALYAWWRRVSGELMTSLGARVGEQDRQRQRTEPGWGLRLFRLAAAARRPLELLLLLSAMRWLLPQGATELLEVQIVSQIVGWLLAGALVVDAINAAFSAEKPGKIDLLRLRSLRLVGRVVVLFALIRLLSAEMVGQGTIYHWASQASLLSTLPLSLLLVHWWRDELFERVERERKKHALHRWLLGYRHGWGGFVAATIAAVYVVGGAAVRAARLWLNRFNLARRAHAYLFRRELDKLDRAAERLGPLEPGQLAAMGPDTPSQAWIPGDHDQILGQLSARIEASNGGVLALVGPRGMGKSQTLRQLDRGDAVRIDAEGRTLKSIRRELAQRLGLDADATLEAIGAHLDAAHPRAILLDNAHSLIRPTMGGLESFDRLMAVAREHSKRAVWVLAIDDILWSFLTRARGVYPLFDDALFLEPWPEERIAALLLARSAQADLAPSFTRLLDEPLAGADEQELSEALLERKRGYFRLVWDQTGGNPGVALEVWKNSLARDDEGQAVVRPLQTPQATELERLPDTSLFVLRAILQLCPASAAQIEMATHLESRAIHDALRYSLNHGYLVREGDRYRVTWSWLQPVEQILLRRQLLVNR